MRGSGNKDLQARLTVSTSAFDAAMGKAGQQVSAFAKRFSDLPSQAGPGLQQLNTAIQSIAPQLQQVGQKAALLGGALIAAFVGGSKAAADYAESLSIAAGALGENEQRIQGLDRVLAASGMKLQTFQMAALGVLDKMSSAREGDAAAGAAFAKLGVNVNDAKVKSLGAVDAFSLVAEKLNKIKDAQTRLAMARDLGISSRALKILGTGDLGAQITAEMKAASVLTEAQLDQLNKLDGAFDKLAGTVKGTLSKAFAEASPSLVKLLGHLSDFVDAIARFIDANPGFVRAVGAWAIPIGAALLGLGGLLMGLGKLSFALTSINGLLGLFGAGATVAGAGAAAGGAGAAAGATGFAALGAALGPLAVAIGVVAAAVVAFHLVARDLAELAAAQRADAHAAATAGATAARVGVMDPRRFTGGEQGRANVQAQIQALAPAKVPWAVKAMGMLPGLGALTGPMAEFGWNQADRQRRIESGNQPLQPFFKGNSPEGAPTVNINVSANTTGLRRELEREGRAAGMKLAAVAMG